MRARTPPSAAYAAEDARPDATRARDVLLSFELRAVQVVRELD